MPGPDTEILGLFSVQVSVGDSFVRGTRRLLYDVCRESLRLFRARISVSLRDAGADIKTIMIWIP